MDWLGVVEAARRLTLRLLRIRRRGLIPAELVEAARDAVDAGRASGANGTRASDAGLTNLFHESPLANVMADATGSHKPINGYQIALHDPASVDRFGGNVRDAPMDNPFNWVRLPTSPVATHGPSSGPWLSAWSHPSTYRPHVGAVGHTQGGHIDGLNAFFWNEPVKGAGQVPTPETTTSTTSTASSASR